MNHSWIFVSGLVPETNIKEIVDYLTDNGVPYSHGEKLRTKRENLLSSFKVSVPTEHKV